MKKTLIVVAVLFFSSCIDVHFVKSVQKYTDTILPEYREYIKNDPDLDDNTKRIRQQTADKFQELLEEATKED